MWWRILHVTQQDLNSPPPQYMKHIIATLGIFLRFIVSFSWNLNGLGIDFRARSEIRDLGDLGNYLC